MIATFFRWRVPAHSQDEFRGRWNEITKYLLNRGSCGSSLWRDDAGNICAFALWPDREARDRAFREAQGMDLPSIQALIEETLERSDMDMLENHWRLPASTGQSTEK